MQYGSGGSTIVTEYAPEPYAGQKYCPVTGERLGERGPAIPVELVSPAARPTFWGRLFGSKPQKVTIYVCCPECVAQVRQDPGKYLTTVICRKSGWEK